MEKVNMYTSLLNKLSWLSNFSCK